MLFNSYAFILLFLPITFVVFFILSGKSTKAGIIWLTLASLSFYALLSLNSLPILLSSVVVNYFLGIKITSSVRYRKILFIFGATSNLLALFYFKYINFFIENFIFLFPMAKIGTIEPLSIALPLGISFFTFTQIAFLSDCFYGKVKERSFIYYLLFVSFFPHLIAGPIIHHQQIMSQFSDSNTYRLNFKKIVLGFTIFIFGLSKKVLIADPLSDYANILFNVTRVDLHPNFLLSWLGSIAYTFQLYFDFSGYSDMAVGLSLLFGIFLPVNFNSPLRATNIISFWQRWHISLTKYINQYLYTPLALKGARLGSGKAPWVELLYSLIVPTLISFLIIGLWHGASWTYVLFGGMHGLLLVINHIWRKRRVFIGKKKSCSTMFNKATGCALTFLSVNMTFVMFRSNSVSSAIEIYEGMLGLNGFTGTTFGQAPDAIWQSYLVLSALLTVSFFVVLVLPSTAALMPLTRTDGVDISLLGKLWVPVLLGLLFALSLIYLSKTSPFLYFQF